MRCSICNLRNAGRISSAWSPMQHAMLDDLCTTCRSKVYSAREPELTTPIRKAKVIA